MGNETNTKLRAKAASIAIKPPLSLSLMVSNGAEIPSGKPVGEAASVLEAALDGEAMTNGY
jgi:hypothetical protein